MTLSPCLASTLTFRRPPLVTLTATANAATASYADDFEQQRKEMKENGIDAAMIQSTLPNLAIEKTQMKDKRKEPKDVMFKLALQNIQSKKEREIN